MSFFSSDRYASFHQLPASMQHGAMPHQLASPPKKSLVDRRVENVSFASTRSSSASLSEFDPLSPLNLQRAADPWHGNSLVPSPANVETVTGGVSSNAQNVFVAEDLEDEDWGEFVISEPACDDGDIFDSALQNHGGGDRKGMTGWTKLSPSYLDDRSYDDDDELTDQALPYHVTSYPKPPPVAPETPSIVTSLLTRLASFGSTSSLTGKAGSRRPSLLLAGAKPDLPPRNYDSYDVTFEKGPIGLELETDWYGRQAVVKGFKSVNNEDGLAKTSGVIRIGDVLTAINGESCLELSFQETLQKLRDVSAGKHTLHFKSLEAAGDLSIYNQDSDIILAKKYIHQHKEVFYRAPKPLPNRKLILGCVERLRGEAVTAFNFHREDTGEFLLACSCVNERTGVFIFHTLQDSHLREFKDLPRNEDSAVYLGQMIPNFLGTEFTILDHQQKRRNELGFIEFSPNVMGRVPNYLKVAFPKQTHVGSDDEDDDEDNVKDETGDRENRAPSSRPRAATTATGMGSNNAVFNTHNSMMDKNGTISERYKRVKQTRRLSLVERLRSFSLDDVEVHLDFSDGSSIRSAWHDDDDHAGQARAMRLKKLRTAATRNVSTPYGAIEQEDFDCDLLTFETRKPSWSEELGAWTLNFQGRVKVASKKNFLIVPEQGNDGMESEFGEDTTYLRFGKVSATRFALDYQHPIPPLVALAIACSSFAHKIAVT